MCVLNNGHPFKLVIIDWLAKAQHRGKNAQDSITDNVWDFKIFRNSRPRLNKTQEFVECLDWDLSKLKSLDSVETEIH